MADAGLNLEHHETHIGVVVLCGEHAYKFKKPVETGYLDFTTRERRREACHREVELNRRLAPDAYLGVSDVLDPDGNPCEHLVVMRRMPAARRLATLVDEAPDAAHHALHALAQVMAAFHREADRGPAIDQQARASAVRGRWRDNLDALGALDEEGNYQAMVDELQRLALGYVDGRGPLFDQRVEGRRVLDGHGDLLAQDIFCLDNGPQPLDCLDFDDRLRWLDGIDDIACLAMDLLRLGADRSAADLVSWYTEFAEDPAPASLIAHYVAYRAVVRAKVALTEYRQGNRDAAHRAERLLTLAHKQLRAAAPVLVLVGGAPGSGKTTVAQALATQAGFELRSSDRVRKQLAGLSPDQPAPAAHQQGIYTAEWTERTYRELLEHAGILLDRGEAVVLDASWARANLRRLAADTAANHHADLLELCCTLPEHEQHRRLRDRNPGTSDADEELAKQFESDPWPSAIAVDTSGTPQQATDAALTALQHPGHDRGPLLRWLPNTPAS